MPGDAGERDYPTDCADPCKPVWSGTSDGGGATSVAVGQGHVFLTGADAICAYAPRPRAGSAASNLATGLVYLGLAVFGLAVALLMRRRRSER